MLNIRLNGNQLKLIAVLSMIIDHAGALFLGAICQSLHASSPQWIFWSKWYLASRTIGRIAFPIFCFMLVEGFLHTANRKRYAARLGIFALISEVPFDLVVFQQTWNMQHQNVYFTLCIGLLMMMAMEEISHRLDGKNSLIPQLFVIAGACGTAWVMRTDYDIYGIMLIALFYWLQDNRRIQVLCGFIWQSFCEKLLCWKAGLAVGFLTILLYNGERGKCRLKYFFSWFYPVHLLVLYGIYDITR